MDLNSPVIYGMEFQTRALTAHLAETDLIQFFVGTQGVRLENQVHLIDFDDETNTIHKNIFLHPDGEIWSIASSSSEKNLISTIYNNVQNSRSEMLAAVWRVGSDEKTQDELVANQTPLKLVTKFDSTRFGDVKSFLWYPSSEKSEVVVLVDGHLVHCDLQSSGSSLNVIGSTTIESRSHAKFTTGAWNPHHNSTQIVTAHDSNIVGWDLKTLKPIYTLDSAHNFHVRHVDFNPNKQYYIASCGDDCKVKFWDTRNTSQPVKTLEEHLHWIWQVRFNHFHDQLILTASSDGRVILSNMASISSEPYGHLIDQEDADMEGLEAHKTIEDGRICTYEEHEDSVYQVVWSCADPWIFASLSYDGRLVINHIPRSTKYQILL